MRRRRTGIQRRSSCSSVSCSEGVDKGGWRDQPLEELEPSLSTSIQKLERKSEHNIIILYVLLSIRILRMARASLLLF